jgi:MFS family permease
MIALRPARQAATVVFVLTGAVSAAWATRVPAVQEHLVLSPAELGVAIAGLELGAVTGLPLGGALVAAAGSRRGLRAGLAVYPTALLGVGYAPNLAVLTLALAVMAAANSVVDVAMNVQGVELERRYGRPMLSSLHAGHSAGLVGGGLAGMAVTAAGVPVTTQFAITAALGVLLGLGATRRLVDEPVRRGARALTRPSRSLLLLGLVAFCAFLLDGAANQWSALHLRVVHGASPWLAAAAFTAFALTLTLGRLAGDRVTARLGRSRTVLAAGLVTAAGGTLAIAAPNAALAVAGWAVFGLGLAPVVPVVLGATAEAGDSPAPVAIAGVTAIGYLGSFTGPPLVGVLAGVGSLPSALLLLVGVALTATLLARPALGRAGADAPGNACRRARRPPGGHRHGG